MIFKFNIKMLMRFFITFVLALLASPAQLYATDNDCEQLKAEIQSAIINANSCNTDGDCTRLRANCPFGCGQYVNESEKSALENRTQEYEKKCGYCLYDCYDPESRVLKCVKGKCETLEDKK